MNLNTACFRIFSVLILATVGLLVVFMHGPKLVIPLAVSVLPTVTAEARYTDPSVWVSGRVTSPNKLYSSEIVYNGHSATLISTTPPGPLIDPRTAREVEWERAYHSIHSDGRSEVRSAPSPSFDVRYVRAFPSMVVRSLPNPSLGRHFAEFWTPGEVGNFLFYAVVLVLVAFYFIRHLRRSTRRRRR